MSGDASVAAVPIPAESRLGRVYASTHLGDAYAMRLPDGATHDPETLARFIFANQPDWVWRLMRLRDRIVGPAGLKTVERLHASGVGRVGIFRIYETHPGEIILGEDDRHLDFRLSVLCRPEPHAGSAHSIVVSTVVHCHNRLGRSYLFVIAPFHRRIIQAGLRRAAEVGWPQAK